jgi:transposase-like protein
MKKRIRHGDPQRRRYWEALMDRWKEGGQTVRAFCRTEGVRESAFFFWRRKLARGDRPPTANSSGAKASPVTPAVRAPKRPLPQHSPAPSFLPVRVVEPSLTKTACGVEIIFAHGREVRVSPGFDRQTLADVLAVLEMRPC